MSTIRDLLESTDEAVIIPVHATPGAGRSQLVGRHGEALRIRVAAPPENGRANEAIAALLADELGVARSAVQLVSGPTARSKRFSVVGLDADAVADLLEPALQAGGRKGPGGPRH